MGISLTLADSARTSWKFWACRVHRGAMPLYAWDWISIVLTCLRFWTRPKSTSLHRLQELLRLDTVPELDVVEPPRRAWQRSDWQWSRRLWTPSVLLSEACAYVCGA